MPGLVPGIHVLRRYLGKDVDARNKSGHDAERLARREPAIMLQRLPGLRFDVNKITFLCDSRLLRKARSIAISCGVIDRDQSAAHAGGVHFVQIFFEREKRHVEERSSLLCRSDHRCGWFHEHSGCEKRRRRWRRTRRRTLARRMSTE